MDNVTGTIIGGEYIEAELIQPSGNPYGAARCFSTEAEARAWADKTVRRIRAEYPTAVVRHCRYDQPWILRLRP